MQIWRSKFWIYKIVFEFLGNYCEKELFSEYIYINGNHYYFLAEWQSKGYLLF